MTIEDLRIEVQATSDQAVSRLEKLEAVLERIDALGHRTGFDKLYQKLKKIASLDFSGTAKGTDGISKSVDKLTRANPRLSKFTQNLKNVQKAAKSTNEEFSRFGRSSDFRSEESFAIPSGKNSSGSTDSTPIIDFDNLFSDMHPVESRLEWLLIKIKAKYSEMNATAYRNLHSLQSRFKQAFDSIGKSVQNSKLGTAFSPLIANLSADVNFLKNKIFKAGKFIKGFGNELKHLNTQGRKTGRGLSYLGKTISRFLIYKALNLLIRGISTGLQNIALYSKEANQVLTQYKTLQLQLSNSLGAALIPVLQALYSAIQALANVLIEVANAVNVLFSAMNGSKTFIKAKKYTDDYAKSLGKLKGLAGMDQIHAIGQTYNYSEMFEDVEMDNTSIVSALATITELVAAVVFLKTLFSGKEWAVALTVLTGKTVRFASILKTVGAICLIIFGAAELVKGTLSAWTNGIDWGNFTRMLIGIAGVVAGIAIQFGAVAAGVALAAGGFLLFVTGVKDLITNGKSLENTLTIIVGLLAMGVGLAIAGFGWIPLAIAAIIAALAALVIWGDEIVAWLENFKGLFDGWITGIKDKIFGFFDRIIDKVKNFNPGLALVLDLIKNNIGAVFDFIKANLDWAITLFQDFVKLIKHLFSGDFKAVWEDMKSYFAHYWQGLWNMAIVPLNFLISCFESLVNY